MAKRLTLLMFGLGLLAVALVFPQRANATLGEAAVSIESDLKTLSAVRQATTTRDCYTVHEIKTTGSVGVTKKGFAVPAL
jgi:hypothetical protein